MKPWALGALALALACAGGFALGRYDRRPPSVTEKIVTRVEYRDRVQTVAVKQAAEVKRVVIYRERVTKPDGTVIDRVAEHADTDTRTAETAKTDTRRESTTVADRTTVTTAKPDWRIGVLVGGSLPSPTLPISGPLAVGVLVERRILGPFSLGVWGLSSGQAGLSLSGEF